MAWAAVASLGIVVAVGMAKPELVNQLQLAQGVAEAAGAVMALVASRHVIGRARLAWALFAVGLGIWCATDLMFGAIVVSGWEPPDAVTIFDIPWLAFYVPMLAGVGLLYMGLRTERGWQGLLDAALIALSAGVFGWVGLLGPTVSNSSQSPVAAAVNTLYPAFDIAALVSIAWLMLRLGKGSPIWLRVVACAFGLQAVADLSYLAGSVTGPRLGVVSAALFTAAGWLWAVAARLRIDAPQRVWNASRRSIPPVWSQVLPAVLGLSLIVLALTGPGRLVVLAAFCGAVLMVIRLVSVLFLDRVLMAERSEVSAMRARLLDEERSARRAADEARAATALQNERLTELDRLKDEFMAMVSHEFRTPLTSIENYLYAVLAEEVGPLEAQQRQFLTVVQRNGVRLARLVEDLLLFARIRDGRLGIDIETVDIVEILTESVEAARPAARQAGVQLIQGESHEVVGRCDRGRIGQVLDNLISNAIKFTPEGGRVLVDLEAREGGVAIEVADTGPGIGPDELGQLFTPFYRTRHATENVVPGTGLGLAISKAIVESHDGEIGVRSRVGRGTVFRVTLPVGAARTMDLFSQPAGALQ